MSNEPGIIVCPNPRCHRKIEEPILLKSLSRTPVEQYYACPHCLIKLDVNVENVQLLKEREKEKEREKPIVEPMEKEGKGLSGCLHHLGYLANRAKNASIPQECLICPKTVECILELS